MSSWDSDFILPVTKQFCTYNEISCSLSNGIILNDDEHLCLFFVFRLRLLMNNLLKIFFSLERVPILLPPDHNTLLKHMINVQWGVRQVFANGANGMCQWGWSRGNWSFPMFDLTYSDNGELHEKETKNYLPEEKVAILKRHLVDKLPLSDLCDEYALHPTVFYRWQKEFFDHGAAAFERDSIRQKNNEAVRIRELEQKLQRKNEVLSELM